MGLALRNPIRNSIPGTVEPLLTRVQEISAQFHIASLNWKIEVAEPHQPDIRVGRTFDFHFGLIWFLIPMFIFRLFF